MSCSWGLHVGGIISWGHHDQFPPNAIPYHTSVWDIDMAKRGNGQHTRTPNFNLLCVPSIANISFKFKVLKIMFTRKPIAIHKAFKGFLCEPQLFHEQHCFLMLSTVRPWTFAVIINFM